MAISFPNTTPNALSDIITKVRRITGRPSQNQISDNDIVKYINTFYIWDFPEHLRLENLRVNYEFTTAANIPVYDFPTSLYLTIMPPVFMAGYQSYMTQSRQNFFRINPQLNFLQQAVYTGDGTNGSGGTYTGQFLINTPIIPGFKPNPPGAFVPFSAAQDIQARFLNFNVLVSAQGTPDATSGISPQISLIDDGLGHLFAPTDTSIDPANARGTINYITGAITVTNFTAAIPQGNPINVEYIPYVPSRPQSCMFFQDQVILYPVPDQAYTISFECYEYPTSFLLSTETAQVQEWWQCLALGACLKVFEDNGDMENYMKYRPIFDEYMLLVQRRTIVQQTSERTSTIYTEETTGYNQFGFGNNFSGF